MQDEILDRFMVFNRFKDADFEFRLMYSATLGHYFVVTEKEIIFDDGVIYKVKELALLMGFSDSELKFQHTGRQVFGDEVRILG
jgi:hypothetical protein